jgi:hypothetical protein
MIAGDIDADAGAPNADGGGIYVLSGQDITVAEGADLAAQGSGSGDGGVIRLIAKEVLDVEANTSVTTEGGATGQGGFVEVSGHAGVNIRGEVDVGTDGELLLDPAVLTIRSGGRGTNSTGATFTIAPSFSYGGNTIVYEEWLEDELQTSNITLVASNNIGVQSAAAFDGLGIDVATGSKDLKLVIGTVGTAVSGSLANWNSDFPCPSLWACVDLGSGGGGNAAIVGPGTSFGDISLVDSSGNYVNISIDGDLEIRAGSSTFSTASGSVTVFNGDVFARTLQGNTVTVHGNVQTSNTSGVARLNITGRGADTAGRSVWLNGDVTVTGNGVGASRLEVNGNGLIQIDGDLRVENGAGDAFLNVRAANGIQLNGAAIAMASASNNPFAWVELDAGSGDFSGAFTEIYAFDQIQGSCGEVVGPNCWSTATGFDGGLTVTGLLLPSFSDGLGSASVDISGANVNLDTPFAFNGSADYLAEGVIGAVGGKNATVTITSTVGDINVGTLASGAPFIGVGIGSGTTAGTARLELNSALGINVYQAATPIIESFNARYYSLLASADSGNEAVVSLLAESALGNIQINGSKTLVAAHATGSSSALNASASINMVAGASGDTPVGQTLNVQGQLEAKASGSGSLASAKVVTKSWNGSTLVTGQINVAGRDTLIDVSANGAVNITNPLSIDNTIIGSFGSVVDGGGAEVLINAGDVDLSRIGLRGWDSTNPLSVDINATGAVTVRDGIAVQNHNGDASLNISANGVLFSSGGIGAGAAARNGNAFVSINAGSGALNFNGNELLALDFIPTGGCSYGGGSTCFTPSFSGSIFRGLVIPTMPHTGGNANISLAGTQVNISTPFDEGISGSGALGVRGLVTAMAGNRATISVNATAGSIALGSATVGAPMVFAQAGSAGAAQQQSVQMTAAHAIQIYDIRTPIINGLNAENYAIFVRSLGGGDALIDLDGGTVGLNINSGAVIHAQASGSTGANATVDVDVLRPLGGTITLDGELRADAQRIAYVEVRAPSTFINSTARLEANGINRAHVGVDGFTNMQLDGDLIATATTFQADVYISGSSGVTIGSSASMLASAQGSLGEAGAWVWGGNNSITIDGTLQAYAPNGNLARAEVWNSASVDITLGSTGFIEALGGSASVLIGYPVYCETCSINLNGDVLAHTSPTANDGNASIEITGEGVTVSGTVEAHLHSGNVNSATVFINAGGSSLNRVGDFTLSGDGLIVVSDNGELGFASTTGGAVNLPLANPGVGYGSIHIEARDINLLAGLGTNSGQLTGAVIVDASDARMFIRGERLNQIGNASGGPLLAARGFTHSEIQIDDNFEGLEPTTLIYKPSMPVWDDLASG